MRLATSQDAEQELTAPAIATRSPARRRSAAALRPRSNGTPPDKDWPWKGQALLEGSEGALEGNIERLYANGRAESQGFRNS